MVSVTTRDALADKLRPGRFTAMSVKMAAVVGYILDEPLSEPTINQLVVTSDGFVLAERSGDVGANEMLGTEEDLNRNLVSLIERPGCPTTRSPSSAGYSASASGATAAGQGRNLR